MQPHRDLLVGTFRALHSCIQSIQLILSNILCALRGSSPALRGGRDILFRVSFLSCFRDRL